MGKRGPKPTPTSVLKMRGSWRADLRRDEPQPGTKPPRCPSWMRPEAKAAWRLLVPKLARLGLLTEIDGNALARYCDAWARWKSAAESLAKNGEFYTKKGPDGALLGVFPHPAAGQYIKLAQMLNRLESDFGLTPSARADLAQPKPVETKDNGKRRFFA